LAGLQRQKSSWNGYEHNVLLMNRGERGFLDVAFLMGVAFEFDARAVVSDDLNGDGRPDLLIVENQLLGGQFLHQTLHVLANQFQSNGHWIGVRVPSSYNGLSSLGVKVTLTTATGKRVARIVAGDSLFCQHSSTVHFGLGTTDEIERVEIEWPGGQFRRIENPAIDAYHEIVPEH
jgi:hypothetical protein